jgi:hypothetical protein
LPRGASTLGPRWHRSAPSRGYFADAKNVCPDEESRPCEGGKDCFQGTAHESMVTSGQMGIKRRSYFLGTAADRSSALYVFAQTHAGLSDLSRLHRLHCAVPSSRPTHATPRTKLLSARRTDAPLELSRARAKERCWCFSVAAVFSVLGSQTICQRCQS